MKYQVLFSLKSNEEVFIMSSAAIVILGLRVEVIDIHFADMYGTFSGI